MLGAVSLALAASVMACRAQDVSIPVVPKTKTTSMSPATKTTTTSETKTTSDAVFTHTISVGAADHKFTPEETEAEIGDVIEYRFYPETHWVIRGDFDNPCIPYEYFGTDRQGFSSGAQSVEGIPYETPRFRVRVNDTDPIFYYCGAAASCVDWHMVGVINPSDNQTLEMFQEKAKDVDFQLRPGDSWPSRGEEPSGNDSPRNGSKEGATLQPGAIAGIAVGGSVVLVLAALLIFFCRRRRRSGLVAREVADSASRHYQGSVPPVGEAHHAGRVHGDSTHWSPEGQSLGNQGYYSHRQPSPMPPMPVSSPAPLSHHGTGTYTYPFSAETLGPFYSWSGTGSHIDLNMPDSYLVHTLPNESPKSSPVGPFELPSSSDPGHSPLPKYTPRNRHFSWVDDEMEYRPSK